VTPESLAWRKSTYSAVNGCVEVAFGNYADGAEVAVRDSKEPDGAGLYFTRVEWQAFLEGARAGEFDLP
jgi:Domain of unknown function (DUF397)